MKIFQHANLSGKDGDVCVICQKKDDKPVILIPIVGTEEDGLMQARQAHVDCIDLFYYPEDKIIAQKIK